MDALLELFIELFGGLIMEGLAELISRIFRATTAPRSPADAVHIPRAILCQVAGVIAGLISLLFASHHIITSPPMRFINLALTPLLMALALIAWGRFMQKQNQEKVPLNRFVCAYGFALCYMLTRFAFAM
jgi:hypothetical protein